MFYDLQGNPRQKVGLHIHTSRSDGAKSPEETVAIYRNAGYDAISFTDHWIWSGTTQIDGFTVLSGIEYHLGGADGAGFMGDSGVYHITGIGCTEDPALSKDVTPEEICAAIREKGGIAVLAHPAWSLNDPGVVAKQNCYDATEIYNTVSGVHHSCRPDSSAFVDLLACHGVLLPLIAADDAHYYDNDAAVSWVCVKCDTNEPGKLMDAIKKGHYYASQGPEVHLYRDGNKLIVDCSPVSSIYLYSNTTIVPSHTTRGDGLTHAESKIVPSDLFVRAEVIDNDGKRAWTGFLKI